MQESSGSGLSYADLLELRRWNTPTIYNGWEQITRHDAGREGFNPEPCQDFMPEIGPIAGRAVTVVMLDLFDKACDQFGRSAEARFGRRGE